MYTLFEFRTSGNVAMSRNGERFAIARPEGKGCVVIFRDKSISKGEVKSFFKRYFATVEFN